MGISSFFGSIGMAGGPAIGSWIFLTYGINTLFYLNSALAIMSLVVLMGMKETLKDREKFNFSMLKVGKADIFEPKVLKPSIAMILTTLGFGTVVTLAPDFGDYLEIENRGLFFIVFTGSSLLVRIAGGKVSDKFGRRVLLKYSTSILFVSLLVIGFSTSALQFFIGAFIFGIGYGLNSPTLFAWTVDLSPNLSRGRGVSTLFIFLEIGIGTGALISGSYYQGINERFPLIFGIAALFSLFAFFYLQLTSKKPSFK